MRILKGINTISLVAVGTLTAHASATLSMTNLNALQGLVPVTAPGNTDAGKGALSIKGQ